MGPQRTNDCAFHVLKTIGRLVGSRALTPPARETSLRSFYKQFVIDKLQPAIQSRGLSPHATPFVPSNAPPPLPRDTGVMASTLLSEVDGMDVEHDNGRAAFRRRQNQTRDVIVANPMRTTQITHADASKSVVGHQTFADSLAFTCVGPEIPARQLPTYSEYPRRSRPRQGVRTGKRTVLDFNAPRNCLMMMGSGDVFVAISSRSHLSCDVRMKRHPLGRAPGGERSVVTSLFCSVGFASFGGKPVIALILRVSCDPRMKFHAVERPPFGERRMEFVRCDLLVLFISSSTTDEREEAGSLVLCISCRTKFHG